MRRKHSIDLLFSLSLFTVFVLCAFLILLFQTDGYHQINEKSKHVEQIHTPLAYIRTKLRASDETNKINTFKTQQVSGIKINDVDTKRVLYIYEDQHKLKELNIVDNITPDFTTGTALFALESFQVEKQGSRLRLELIDKNKQTRTLNITLNCQ